MTIPSVSRDLRMILQAHGRRPAGITLASAFPTDVAAARAHEQLREASTALANAFRALTRTVKAVDTAPGATTAPAVTMLSALGLDPASALRPLSSSAAGAATSLGAASRLYSAALGLNVTSPETASTVRSSAALGLDVTSRSSTIASTAEMNTATTSYGSDTLDFAGAGLPSTSVGTLSGTYTGINTAASATSLVVKSTQTAVLSTLAATAVRFEVRDQAATLLFSYDGSLKAGDTVYLGADIGLSVSFSAGQLSLNHTASTTVSHAPVEVDADATFNHADPDLRPQFDGGAQVTAGAFTINGTSIAVNADDTINAVLARINASAAGVTASLANDRITFATAAASEADVVLAGDTSGFLSAVKLAAATTTRGNLRDDQQALSQTTRFGGVVSGAFTINGVTISVDKDLDTLASIVSQINGAGAGVTASYDSTQDKLVLTTASKSEDLITVAGDTSGFLAAAGLSTNNTVRGNIRDDQQVLSKTTQFGALSSGSFTVNGQSITVNVSTDSLTTLVARINAAGAGVTAAYDATLDKLLLTATANNDDPITVAGDTTGFLATAGLSTANTVRGTLRHDQQAASKTSPGGVGTVDVNGKSLTVDLEHDTLATLVDRVNRADAGVTATFNASTNSLTVSNGGTVAATVAAAVEKVNAAFAQLDNVRGASSRRSDVEATMRRVVSALGDAGVRGLSVSTDGGEIRLSLDRAELASTLTGLPAAEAVAGAALGGLLDGFTGQIAALALPATPERGAPGLGGFQPGDEMKARLAKLLIERYRENSRMRTAGDGSSITRTG